MRLLWRKIFLYPPTICGKIFIYKGELCLLIVERGDKVGGLTNPERIRVDKDVEEYVSSEAARRKESKAEVYRRLLRQAVEREKAENALDPVLTAVRQAMKDVIKPVEERLAKINAKTAVASATAMYTNIEVLGQMGKDVRGINETARKKAVAFVKMPHDELLGEKE